MEKHWCFSCAFLIYQNIVCLFSESGGEMQAATKWRDILSFDKTRQCVMFAQHFDPQTATLYKPAPAGPWKISADAIALSQYVCKIMHCSLCWILKHPLSNWSERNSYFFTANEFGKLSFKRFSNNLYSSPKITTIFSEIS